MKIRTKLVAVLLGVAIVPSLAIGVVGVQSMQQVGDFAQKESTDQLETQVTGELNTTVESRQERIADLLTAREVDARSLADSASVENFHAAGQGEMDLVQEQSQEQLGYMALQMHSSIENTKQRVLEAEYGGRSWEGLSASEQEDVKAEVERAIAGTSGQGVEPSGSFFETFQPGYIGDTGYFYFTDLDSNIVAHHSLEEGHNLIEDSGGTLTVFEEVRSNIQSSPEIRTGQAWGVAEYNWEDTTQAGNPIEEKFISYTYYEDFGWIIAPNVYYYELQTTAVADAREEIRTSFESALETRTIRVSGDQRPAYTQIRLVDADGEGLLRSYRTDDGAIQTEDIQNENYANRSWFEDVSDLDRGTVSFSEVRTQDGQQRMEVYTPVYYDGEFAGVVLLTFDYGIISEVVSDVTVGESGHVSIAGEDGRVISHPDETVVSERRNIGAESDVGGLAGVAESQILAGETGLETYTRTENGDSQEYYVGFAPVSAGGTRFTVMATVPEEDIAAPVAALGASMDSETSSARNSFLLVFVGVAAVMIGVGYKGSALLADPVRDLRDRARALSRGEFDEGVESTSRDDEIGELIEAFGEMQTNLQALFEDLNSVSRNLERGTLEQDIETDYPGKYGTIMENLDAGNRQLTASFGEIRRASDSLRTGDLDQQIDTDRPGEYGAVLEDLEAGADQLSASFDQILRASSGLEKGRLDQTFDTDVPGAYGDALQNLETGFDHVNESIAEVQTIADTVADTSEAVMSSTREIEAASQEVADSVQEISQGTDRQSEQITESTEELNSLSATVEEIAASASGLSRTASEAAEQGELGRENAARATAEIGRIDSEAEAAVEQVTSLDEEMETIGEIVRMINEIAEQTNMLALNASIEAARAGEAGEGFAVVADEIKSLASEAAEATAEIETRVQGVQDTTGETVESIREMKRNVENSTETIEETIGVFDEIAESIDDVESGATEISNATDDQAASTEEIVSMMDGVSSVAQQTATEASNVSATSEEQASSLSGVGQNAEQLSAAATDLFELVGQFEVADTGSAAATDASGSQTASAADGGFDRSELE